jgi:RNA polymerase sigma-70 factor (ECF subfamily)
LATIIADEESLIEAAKARLPDAWARLYDLHYLPLYRYAYARIRNREDAEDIASQVFVEALRKIDGYSYRGKPIIVWLYRIGRNLIIDGARRRGRHERYAESQRVLSQPATGGGALDESVELLDAISRLTDDQREVIILRFVMSLSAHETALAIGKKEAAVYSLQVRGVNTLRKMFTNNATVDLRTTARE